MLCIIKAKKISLFYQEFNPWLEEVSRLCDRFYSEVDGRDRFPLHNHEQSTVSIFASAAGKLGYLPLAEYQLEKRMKSPKALRLPGRPKHVPGRADFWMLANKNSYSFEFKRIGPNSSNKILDKNLKLAKEDAENILKGESDVRVGVLVAGAECDDSINICKNFAHEAIVDFCWAISPAPSFATFLYFSVVKN